MSERRTVRLRSETFGSDSRFLSAWITPSGDLRIDGQDLGPGIALVSSDGEYEWYQTIQRAEIPRLLELLGAHAESDVLDVLEEKWTGANAYRLEELLRESDINVDLFVWSG